MPAPQRRGLTATDGWQASTMEDDFLGPRPFAMASGQKISIAVSCTDDNLGYVVALLSENGFRHEAVDVRWDESDVERFVFRKLGNALVAWSSSGPPLGHGRGYDSGLTEFVAKLRRHDELRIRVSINDDDLLVTDRFDLAGSSSDQAIDTLPCAKDTATPRQ